MLPDFGTFFSSVLSSISSFLLSEPINYFVGLTVLFYVVALVNYIMRGRG